MTFDEARKKLKEITGGRYRALYYELTEDDRPTRIEPGCRLYCEELEGHNGISTDTFPTWEQAFAHMEVLLSREKEHPVDLSEAPVQDVPAVLVEPLKADGSNF